MIPMQPEELERIRHSLKITQAQAAARMGVHERTWRKWAGGHRPIPHPVAKLLRLMATDLTGRQVKIVERTL